MAAQTATKYIGKATVMRLANLQLDLAGSGANKATFDDGNTHTVTLVYNDSTGAVTVDYAES